MRSEAIMHTTAEILAGQAGLAGVQQLLTGGESQQRLRQALSTLTEQPAWISGWRLQRAKLKPHRKLTAYYDLTLSFPTGSETIRPLAVTWTPPASSTTITQAEWKAVQADAVACQLAAPFHTLRMDAPEQGLTMELAPLDAHYPHLIRLSDPSYVRELLGACQGSGQPVQTADDYAIQPIRYRPRQRHVLRYDPLTPTRPNGPRPIFAKLYRDASQQPRFPVMHQVAEALAHVAPNLRALRPLACVAADRVMLYPWAEGEPLSHLLCHAKQNQAASLRQTGVALRTLHAIPTGTLASLSTHDFATEVKLIVRTCEQIQLLLPTVGHTIQTLLERAQAGYDQLPQESPAFVHGDFKADHVLVTPDCLTLIDFDSCALADPAYDIGKFLADLAWWHTGEPSSALKQAQGSFLAGYGLSPAHPRLRRALLWAVLIGIKMAAHRVPLFAPDWADRTTTLIDRTASTLPANWP
jgi:aminoglycoside phosphotransferase (APT) family kinase protein